MNQNDTASQQTTWHTTREDLPNGVIVLTYLDSSRQAIDDMLTHINDVIDERIQNPSDTSTQRMLLDDTQVKSLPIAYMFDQIRQRLVPRRNEYDHDVRLAALINNAMMASMVNWFVSSLRMGIIFRLFTGQQREEAIEWLLQDD